MPFTMRAIKYHNHMTPPQEGRDLYIAKELTSVFIIATLAHFISNPITYSLRCFLLRKSYGKIIKNLTETNKQARTSRPLLLINIGRELRSTLFQVKDAVIQPVSPVNKILSPTEIYQYGSPQNNLQPENHLNNSADHLNNGADHLNNGADHLNNSTDHLNNSTDQGLTDTKICPRSPSPALKDSSKECFRYF